MLTRRFEGALDLLAAWGWNVVHLPGTISRRVRAQSVRKVPDRQLRRFMESAGVRLPRWFTAAGQIFEEQREIEEQDEGASVSRRLRDRTASLVGSHPVVVASFVAALVGAVALRGLFGPEPLHGGALAVFPGSWRGFFGELTSAYRTTGLGGTLAASPALGAMGALSWLTFGSTALAQKVLLAGGPLFASIMLYRALARITGRPDASVLGAVAYGLSAMVLWGFSEGRIGLLVALCVLPAMFERLEVAFGRGELPDGRWRFIAGVAVTLAVGMAFMPGVALAVGVLVGVQVLFGRSRVRGVGIAAAAFAAAAVLLFPFVPTVVFGDAVGFGSRIGTTDLGALGRLALGGGPGTWSIAAFLPIAAVLAFSLVGPEHPRRRGSRRGHGDRRPRARVVLFGRLPPRVGRERSHLSRARRGRGGGDRGPGALVGAVGPGTRVVRAAADRHRVAGGRAGRRDRAPVGDRHGRRLGLRRSGGVATGVGRRLEQREG